jgi:flavin-dependent dehydrogenase
VIDVAIIGGGPAGSAAAIACARAGLGAVVFERRGPADEAGDKDSTEPEESIGPDCVALLAELGIDCLRMSTPFAGVAVGNHLAVFGDVVPVAGFHLRRSRLDRELRTAATRSGATVRLGVGAGGLESYGGMGFLLQSSIGPIAARQLIDASGRRSWLARRLGLQRNRRSPPLLAWRDVLTSPDAVTGAVARFTPRPDGWTWLADVSPGRVVRTRLAATGSAARLGRAARSAAASTHAATWRVTRQLAGKNWFIAGEAAAALDPATGSGVSFALRSGLAAGRAAAAAATEPCQCSLIAALYDNALLSDFESAAATLAHHYRRLGIRILDDQ